MSDLTLPTRKRLITFFICTFYLSIEFILFYAGPNSLAGLRSSYYELYFPFELSIPLIPWMIYFYISIDLYFLLVLFTVKETEEIKSLARTIGFAIFMAGIIFILFPGKLGLSRPETSHWLLSFVYQIDNPHNLFPSLHVALTLITTSFLYKAISDIYLKAFIISWASLIIVSVLFTHQHHLFDIFSGTILAIGCLSLQKRIFPIRAEVLTERTDPQSD